MKVFKNADVYAPKYLGKKDILVEGEVITKIADTINEYDNITDVEKYDLQGKKIVPGYIDMHEHITGGGGEQGPASRTPEASIGTLLENGVTTVIGLLGTDGITRSIENLLAKARALNEEGITCYILTGSYGYPTITLTGDLERDIILIDLIIGTKVAVSDHRSSNPTGDNIIALGTATRRAGLLSSKCGLVTMHMGSGKGGLEPVFYALEHSDIPPQNFLPTHMNSRGQELIDQGVKLTEMGGNIDFTVKGNLEENKKVAEQIEYALNQGVNLAHLTCSSDAYGSQPRFNETGECIGLSYVTPCGLHQLVQQLVNSKALSLEKALMPFTSNPARVLNMSSKKGNIIIGADADLIVYDDNFAIESVLAKGKIAVWEHEHLIKGRFEV